MLFTRTDFILDFGDDSLFTLVYVVLVVLELLHPSKLLFSFFPLVSKIQLFVFDISKSYIGPVNLKFYVAVFSEFQISAIQLPL